VSTRRWCTGKPGLAILASACALIGSIDSARADIVDRPTVVAAQTPRPARAYDLQMGVRLAWTQLRDPREVPLAGGPGMAFDMGYRPTRFLAVGGELVYTRYGWSHHEERFRLVDARGAETPLYLRYARKTDLAPLHFYTRLQPSFGFVRPYLQGSVGLTIFNTIVDHDSIEGDETAVIDDWQPVALSAAAEVGLDIVLARQRYSSPAAHLATLLLSIGVRRMWNTRATYGLPGPLAAGSARSPTTCHTLLVGITARADRL
jgi:hypothetical protein